MAQAKAHDRSEGVRQAIREHARDLFARKGFQETGLRDIAAAAGVNHALIIRHFGSKENLFLETMTVPDVAVEFLQVPVEQLGKSLARWAIESYSRNGLTVYAALLGAAQRPEVRTRLQGYIVDGFVHLVSERLTGTDAGIRAHMAATQVIGLLTSLALELDPVLTAMDPEPAIAYYGHAIQTTLTGRIGE